MIGEKTESIEKIHQEVYTLQKDLKRQEKDKGDVILRLTKENDEAMKHMIELESIIQEYEKKNEKQINDTNKDFKE